MKGLSVASALLRHAKDGKESPAEIKKLERTLAQLRKNCNQVSGARQRSETPENGIVLHALQVKRWSLTYFAALSISSIEV